MLLYMHQEASSAGNVNDCKLIVRKTKMKHFISVLLILVLFSVLCGFAAAASAAVTVGTDIQQEDISDFYYTVDASIDPPVYQRYRFYVEDGKKQFYHESRQGGGWPQTEEDIVASGTVELTDEDWAAFFDCLRGGTVRARSDEVLDGDDGPWLYLYWTGDEGEIQEFRFASLTEQTAFEALCSRLAQNHILTRFYYCLGGEMMPLSYEITFRNGVWFIQENDDEPRLFDADLAEELRKVVQEYDMEAWDGFNKSNAYVLDGISFSLAMRFADGFSVHAYGDNVFPENYDEATERIEAILQKDKMASLAGTYLYEGEGFGGDFIITLNADGTYTFYEGALSSYLGGGTWDVYYNTVYMTEENGFELSFTFGVEDGALIYLEMGSDPFPYVNVADEARFKRQLLP